METFFDFIVLLCLIGILLYDIYTYYSIFILNKYVENEALLVGRVLEMKKGYTKRGAYLFISILIKNNKSVNLISRYHSLFRLIEFWFFMKKTKSWGLNFFYCKNEGIKNDKVVNIYGLDINKQCSSFKKNTIYWDLKSSIFG